MFKLDSPLMNFLNKVADIMILNFMILVFSFPVFTIGASLTAAYYMGYKMVKNEESYIIKGFVKSFKENFKQATIIWLLVLLITIVIVADYRIIIYSGIEFNSYMRIAMIVVTVVVAMGVVFMFPLQARYTNTVKNTMKNALLMALSHLPTSFVLIVVYAVPIAILYFIPQLLPALVLLAFGGIIYFKSFLLLKVFKKYEVNFIDKDEEEAQAQGEDPDGGIFEESEMIEAAGAEDTDLENSEESEESQDE